MDTIQAIILGFIQGVTEWLPISSTGHLRVVEQFLGLRLPLLFDVILHLGTLAVILFFFRKDIKPIFTALINGDFRSENGRLIPLIIIGTIPTAFIGLVFNNTIEAYFSNTFPIAVAFLTCGVLLFISKQGRERTDKITYLGALGIGVTNIILMMQNSVYSVITPEGCASILWRDATRADSASSALKITARDLYSFGIIDKIVPEPIGGAHTNHAAAAAYLKKDLLSALNKLTKMSPDALSENRYKKFRKLGEFKLQNKIISSKRKK